MLLQPSDVTDIGESAMRLAVATLVGAALGLNRELKGKPAGLRTHALVALGSALTTITALELGSVLDTDPNPASRAVQGIITGIGFLGGGVILRDHDRNTVRGLTTAATIWIAAALGIACGVGRWRTALVAIGMTLFVLVAGGPIEGLATKLVEHFRDPDTNPDPARRSTAPPRPSASGASRPRTESERESDDRSEGDDESPGDPSGPDSPGPGPGGPGGGKRGRRRRRKPPPPPPFPR